MFRIYLRKVCIYNAKSFSLKIRKLSLLKSFAIIMEKGKNKIHFSMSDLTREFSDESLRHYFNVMSTYRISCFLCKDFKPSWIYSIVKPIGGLWLTKIVDKRLERKGWCNLSTYFCCDFCYDI